MRATLRLVLTYFCSTPLMRGLAITGLVLCVTGLTAYDVMPLSFRARTYQDPDDWVETLLLGLPWFGLIFLLTATTRMPAIIERLLSGRLVAMLPACRGRVFASALIPPLLLALLTTTGAYVVLQALYTLIERDLDTIIADHSRIFLMAFIDFGLVYAAVWLVGKTSGVWRLVGALCVIVSVTIPLRYLAPGMLYFSLLEGLGLACWVVFGVLVLSPAPVGQLLRRSKPALRLRGLSSAGYSPGDEATLLLGTARPWIVAFGQIVPVAAMAWLIPHPGVWLMFLATFSAIAGAFTSQAAGRSRALWLRFDWNRDTIRRQVERAYWRYNGWSLAVLALLATGLGWYAALEESVVIHAIVLIALGGAVSHYLGLMITRELGLFESMLGILTMIALVLGAFAVANEQFLIAIQLEIVLAALAITFRVVGCNRWRAMDWMRCRG